MTDARQTAWRSGDFWLLILVALGLLLAWSVIVPVFESPDEPHHWQFARYLHDERRLPVYGPEFIEANSPPLYYALIAPVAVPGDVPPPLSWRDANGALVFPLSPRYFHNAGGDLRRYRPVYQARLLSVLISILGVWCAYRCGLEVGGRSLAIMAASLMAFLPQFTFRASTISNDVLVTTLAAATMWGAVLLLRRGFTWRRALLLATSLAGAYLSKISAICLVGPVALAVFWSGGPLRTRIVRTGLTLSATLLLVAPWSVRNVLLYGDPFASGAMDTAVSHIIAKKSLTSPYFWTIFPSLLSRSFVGVFGWMNLFLPRVVYWAYWAVGLTGLTGLALQLGRRRGDLRLAAVLATAVVLNIGVVVHINRSFDQPQGRYLFPALPAVALLVAMGLHALVQSERRRLAVARVVAVGMVLANGFILTTIIVPAYYPPITSDLWNELRYLGQPRLVGLERESAGALRLTGDDPRIAFSPNLDAARFGFLQFEVSGQSDQRDMVGGIFFSTDNGPLSEASHVAFRWRADGAWQSITVPLLSHPLWRGTVTTLRIDPVNAGAERHLGESLRVERVRLSDNVRIGESLISIDVPADRATVGASFVVAGWAIDLPAADGAGVDAVHIWARPASGGSPRFLGAAEYGASRPDVVAIFGSQFERSGYRLLVDGLAPGRYVVIIYARSTRARAFTQSRALEVEVH